MLIALYLALERVGTPLGVRNLIFNSAWAIMNLIVPRFAFPDFWESEERAVEAHNQEMEGRVKALRAELLERRLQVYSLARTLEGVRSDFVAQPKADATIIKFLDDTIQELQITREKDQELLQELS